VALGYRASDDAPSGSARTRPRKDTIEVVHLNAW
jgi:hypothetical protein